MIALFPALGDSLRTQDRAGQAERVTWEFQKYGEAFSRALYWSYADEEIHIGKRWESCPARAGDSRWVTALFMVTRNRDRLEECSVARVLNFTGVIPALIAKAQLGLPFVLQYGYDYDELARLRPKLLRRRGRRLQYALLRALAFRQADALIVNTETMATKLKVATRYPSLPVHVIPNGVPLWQFWPSASMRMNIRSRVIYVGRLAPEKNLVRLVEAVSRLRPRAELLLIGEGPERPRIAEAARTCGMSVLMPGTVPYDHVPEWMRGADAFCLPSLSEGSPKALYEAMATGLACSVSTGVPGPRHLPVERFDPTSVEDMQRAIQATLDVGHSTHHRESFRAYVAKHHDLEQTLAAEIAVCRSVAR